MPVVPAEQNRRTETPNAVMTTLASPTQGATEALSLWRIEMDPDAQGPLHAFDTEQVWTVLAGSATVLVGEDVGVIAAGDTVVLPAGAPRQVTAGVGFVAIATGYGTGRARVVGETEDRGTPDWVA